jgi:Tfp pilus assembly pilus retraction ATPase PilT
MDATEHREPEINKLFRMARKHEASDIYLHVGSAPQLELRGVVRQADMPPLTQEVLERLVSPILYEEQRQRLGQGESVAFTYSFEEGDVYHVEVSSKDGCLSLSAHRLGSAGSKV